MNKNKSYKKNNVPVNIGGGIATNKQEELNPNVSGAKANQEVKKPTEGIATTALQVSQNQSAEDTVKELSQQGFAVQQLLKESLQAKSQAAPYVRKIAGVQKRMGKISIADYKGIPIDQALQLMRNDMAQLDSERSYYQLKQQETQQSATDLVTGIKDMLNSQLEAANLEVTYKQNERDFLEQFNVQMAAKGGGGGGGSSTSGSDVDTKAFFTDIYNMQKNLESGLVDWGQAFNYIALRHPANTPQEIEDRNYLIDQQLNKEKWSKPGAYEAQEAQRKNLGKTEPSSDINSLMNTLGITEPLS